MPSATGLMRLGLVIAAVFAAGIAALVAATALIPADTVRQAVFAEIRAVTGLEPSVRGEVAVSVFPSATVSFSDVVLGDGRSQKPALAADRLTTKLQLLPLLLGRIEPADMALTRPRLLIALEPDGRSNWSGLMATLARTLKPGSQQPERVLSFSEIRMTDGAITVTDAARGISEELSGMQVSFAWPAIARSFGATGRFNWRGETFDASANAADLLAAVSGDRSGLKLRLAGAPLKLAFDGSISQRPSLKLEGTLAADGKSLREVLRWASQQPLPGAGLGPFALKAQTTLTGGNIVLSGVNIELDGNVAEGVMALATEPRVAVKGTLAADGLDLTPYLAAINVLRSDERDWSRGPIAVGGLSNFDLDMRLSAARVTVATARLGRTGVAANLRDGRLTVAIGEAQAYGGVLKGALVLANSGAGADIKAQIQFAEVELESCLGELFGIRRLEGKGHLTLALEASGDSVMALTRTLAGTGTLTARQGAITGFNVEQLLKRLEQRPLSIAGDFRRGRTPFEKLDATVKIAEGTAIIEEMRVEGGAVRLALGGSAFIPTRDLDLKGTATLVSASADAAPLFELPFVVQGQWDDPIILPDAQSLIRRSGAAAPLLDAVRDRKTRDSVRSVIDRLSRDGIVTPASRP
ncbi:MAG: AsmA family protein [Alphaproteobacteria bacterium]|nr:MAG: AsmA family protein [Alphaproteobacteria bacterium]